MSGQKTEPIFLISSNYHQLKLHLICKTTTTSKQEATQIWEKPILDRLQLWRNGFGADHKWNLSDMC